MRNSIFYILTAISLQAFASDPESITAKVRVYKNDLDKIYTVFFADTSAHRVNIKLRDDKGKILLSEDFNAKGFSKRFGLSDLQNGEYEFIISFDGIVKKEAISLRSEKDIIAASIQLEQVYPYLRITTSIDHLAPINIYVYNMMDKLQKTFYWEPHLDLLTKEIDIAQFEGYEIRVQIVQEEIEKVDELVLLY
ncbi:MAG: hypothetical protein ACI83W_001198 [Marinoscillum sp.]